MCIIIAIQILMSSTLTQPLGRTHYFSKLLQKCSCELMRSLNVDSLLPYLQREQLVTHQEFVHLIHPNRTNYEKKQFLLSILPSKGENAYKRFICCLSEDTEHTGHAYLVELLTRQMPSRTVSYV